MSNVYPPSLSPGSLPPGETRLAFTWIGNTLADYLKLENKPGIVAKKATKNLRLYHLIHTMNHPTVVELGVDQGVSNIVMQAACNETDGHLYSIDIRDCSAVASSPVCTFIQSDDRDIGSILKQAPSIREGIDLMYIDSMHTYEHVLKLIDAWLKYVKEGGYLVFDDVDNTAYKPGRIVPNRDAARMVAGVTKAVTEFFYANEDELLLELHLGHTGQGIMRKLMPKDKAPNPPVPVLDWPLTPRVGESARALAGAIRRSLTYRFRLR